MKADRAFAPVTSAMFAPRCLQAVVDSLERFRDDLGATDDRHEVGVARPARYDVVV